MTTDYYYDVTIGDYRMATLQERYIESLSGSNTVSDVSTKTSLEQLEDYYNELPNLDSVNALLEGILERNGIYLREDDSFTVSFNPYDYSAYVRSDMDSRMIENIESALNTNNNSRNLFYEALFNSTNINDDAYTKMLAYRNVMEHTGYDLSTLRLQDGNFYTQENRNIVDVLKERLEKNSFLSSYSYDIAGQTQNLLSRVSQFGWNNMPDLDVGIIYSKKAGTFITGYTYSA